MVSYLDKYLQVNDIPDYPGALNGLQVESKRPIAKILAAVDASQASIDAAASTGADLLLVHHGLFWGGVAPIVGRQWRRLKSLLDAGVGVYSSHIPLDCHPIVGNNAVLARTLGITDLVPTGDFKGISIGLLGSYQAPLSEFVAKVSAVTGTQPKVIAGGPESVSRVCVVTGGAGSMIDEVRRAGADTFLTGEGNHHSYFDATEGGLNVVYAGHYATETFGVKALAAHLQQEFDVAWEFFDHPTGL